MKRLIIFASCCALLFPLQVCAQSDNNQTTPKLRANYKVSTDKTKTGPMGQTARAAGKAAGIKIKEKAAQSQREARQNKMEQSKGTAKAK